MSTAKPVLSPIQFAHRPLEKPEDYGWWARYRDWAAGRHDGRVLSAAQRSAEGNDDEIPYTPFINSLQAVGRERIAGELRTFERIVDVSITEICGLQAEMLRLTEEIDFADQKLKEAKNDSPQEGRQTHGEVFENSEIVAKRRYQEHQGRIAEAQATLDGKRTQLRDNEHRIRVLNAAANNAARTTYLRCESVCEHIQRRVGQYSRGLQARARNSVLLRKLSRGKPLLLPPDIDVILEPLRTTTKNPVFDERFGPGNPYLRYVSNDRDEEGLADPEGNAEAQSALAATAALLAASSAAAVSTQTGKTDGNDQPVVLDEHQPAVDGNDQTGVADRNQPDTDVEAESAAEGESQPDATDQGAPSVVVADEPKPVPVAVVESGSGGDVLPGPTVVTVPVAEAEIVEEPEPVGATTAAATVPMAEEPVGLASCVDAAAPSGAAEQPSPDAVPDTDEGGPEASTTHRPDEAATVLIAAPTRSVNGAAVEVTAAVAVEDDDAAKTPTAGESGSATATEAAAESSSADDNAPAQDGTEQATPQMREVRVEPFTGMGGVVSTDTPETIMMPVVTPALPTDSAGDGEPGASTKPHRSTAPVRPSRSTFSLRTSGAVTGQQPVVPTTTPAQPQATTEADFDSTETTASTTQPGAAAARPASESAREPDES